MFSKWTTRFFRPQTQQVIRIQVPGPDSVIGATEKKTHSDLMQVTPLWKSHGPGTRRPFTHRPSLKHPNHGDQGKHIAEPSAGGATAASATPGRSPSPPPVGLTVSVAASLVTLPIEFETTTV
jgi:hypothetical protein